MGDEHGLRIKVILSLLFKIQAVSFHLHFVHFKKYRNGKMTVESLMFVEISLRVPS